MLMYSEIEYSFIYIKSIDSKKRVYPDDKHAFSFKSLEKIKKLITESKNLLGSINKRNKHIKTINDEKILF